MKSVSNLIDINNKLGLPRKYKFNYFIRWTTLIIGELIICYSFIVIFFKINADSPKFFKFVPFILIFLAANSVMRNLFSLNTILITTDQIFFKFLARKTVAIRWDSIFKINMGKDRQRAIYIYYRELGEEKKFMMQLSFPNILEIINSIAEMCDDVEYDDFLKKVIISDSEKAQHS
jgi:hypothetical protein